MRRLLKSAIIALTLLLPGAAARAINSPYTLTGDYMIFNIDSKVISATGNVKLLYGPLTIQADSLLVDVSSHFIKARGNVQLITSAGQTKSTAAAVPVVTTIMANNPDKDEVEKMIEQETAGNQKIYEGDTLVMDLDYIQGMLIQTQPEVRRIFVWGETLDETSPLQKVIEHDDLNDDSMTGGSAVTAKKFMVSPNEKYEAWHTTMWVKGNKIVSLPYFTNTGRGMMPGKWRLRRASYSTNNNLSLTGEIRYKEAAGKRGLMTFNYKDKAERHITADLSQQWRIRRSIGGNFGISNLFAGGKDYTMAFTRSIPNSARSQNMSIRYVPDNSRSLNFNTALPWKKSPIQTSAYIVRDLQSDTKTTNINMFTGGDSKQITKKSKVRFRMTGSAQYMKFDAPYSTMDGVANAFVGMSFYRSAIRVGGGGLLSANMNVNHSATTDGNSSGKVGGNVTYNRNLAAGGLFNTSYSWSRNGITKAATPFSHSMSFSLSFNRLNRWNARLGSMYSFTNHKFNDLSMSMDYKVNRKFNIASSLTYDVRNHRFGMGRHTMRYDLMGTKVDTSWDKESNDFTVNLNSQF